MNPPVNHPRWPRQVELERQMADLGLERFRMQTERAHQSGEGTLDPAIHALLRRQLEPLTRAIKEFLAAALGRNPDAGRSPRNISSS